MSLDHIPPPELTEEDRAVYEWQMWVADFGELGQRKLKGASVLISRCGGVGGLVALQLAAAGIGKMTIAHAGNVRPSDLNRQLLMTHDWIGRPRAESIERRLLELNPRLHLNVVDQNINEDNAADLVSQADIVMDCAPLFQERFAMNRQCVLQNKPLVECAMYELEAQITSILPGTTPCLECLYPEIPANWKRQFPVFGAVSGTIACMAAMEAIKIIAGIGKPLYGRLLRCNLGSMSFKTLRIERRRNCSCCGHL
jgi:molybdopterin/thiamine biosynthesis adenylyltransferase